MKQLQVSRYLLAVFLTPVCLAAQATDAFAPVGAKATITVDYLYESAGKERSEGMYDPYEWNVKRTLNMVADLAAQPTTPTPTMQVFDAAQTADIKNTAAKAESAARKMAPMMADVEKIMAKCGDDEACIARESMALGAAMQGTPQMEAANSAKKDIEALKPGAPRYQAWRPTAQKGTYLIDETAHVSVPDPICAGRPRGRCTRDEVRKGSGAVPVPALAKSDQAGLAGLSGVEVDTAKNTITLMLPVPLAQLPYTETITTDEPEGTHDTPTPKGPQQKALFFRVNVTNDPKSFTVPLKGGWRSQAGEQVIKLKGKFGETGTLTVRWRFTAQ